MLALAPASAQATYGLVGEWRLDEGSGSLARDSSGGGNHGMLGSGAATPAWIGGVGGFALRFDGDDDEVRMPDSAGLEPPRLTVEAWIRKAGTPGSYRYVVSKGAIACDASSYGLYTGRGQGLAFYVSDRAGYAVSAQAEPEAVWDGAWHHVAGTYDGQTVSLFVDGAQIGSPRPAPSAIAYGLPSKNLLLGAYRGDCELPFSGDVDTVRIWNLALTKSEVASAPLHPLDRPAPDAGTPRPGTPAPATNSRSASCVTVTPSRRRVRVRRLTSLTATVRRGARRATRVLVVLTGEGIRRTVRRADSRGRARFVIRPRRKVTLRLRALARRAGCGAPVAAVRVR